MEIYKCIDCWRMYTDATIYGEKVEFNGCKCASIQFKRKPTTIGNRVRAWLSRLI